MRLTLSPRPNGMTIRRVIAEGQTMLELTVDDTTSGKCKLIFHCQADAPFIKELPAELLDEPHC